MWTFARSFIPQLITGSPVMSGFISCTQKLPNETKQNKTNKLPTAKNLTELQIFDYIIANRKKKSFIKEKKEIPLTKEHSHV